jgi:predicted exporter
LIGSVTLGVVVLGATLVSAQRTSMFESDLTVMHPRPNAPLETQHRVSELFQASPDSLLIHLHATSPEELTALAHQTRERLALIDPQQTPIVGSFGLADLLPNPQATDARQVSLAAFDTTTIIADFESVLQESAFNPNAFDPYKVFLRRLFDLRKPPGMTELLGYPGASEMVLPTRGEQGQGFEAITAVINREPLADRRTRDTVIETVRNALDGLPGVTLTGMAVLGYDTERVIRRDLTRLLSFAGTLVIVGLMGYFRSVRAALLAMTPGAFGLVILAGCMYLFEVRLNTMNLIALPLLVGIGVDDGIFLVTIARVARGRDSENLINKLSAACHAVSMTSLTTMLTFGTLAFTSTPAIRSLGILMFMGVMASLVGAIALLVPLLTRGAATTDLP